MRSPVCALVVVLAGGLAAGVLGQGVLSDRVLVGQSCALTGPAEALGTGMKLGLTACFKQVNEQGGVNGRKVELVSEDDGYEPDRAIANTRKLIKDGVFVLIGEVGTPTSVAVVPIAEEAKVPFFGPFTGAEFLRNPYKRYVVNVRGSYFQEMERLAQELVDVRKLSKIACFYQNDGYGQAGLAGIQKALERRNLQLCATGTYERNTTAVRSALLDIRKAEPEAVVMVGAYKPCAEFIKLGEKIGLKAVYCNISFVGTQALIKELGEVASECLISQVVVHPEDATVPIVAEYQKALAAVDPAAKPDFVSLEGFMVGRLFCAVLAQVPGEPTRETFLDTIAKVGRFDVGGVSLEFGAEDHQGMDQVFLTRVEASRAVPYK